MKKSEIVSIVKSIRPRTHVQALKHVVVRGGVLHATNLDISILFKQTSLPDGIYRIVNNSFRPSNEITLEEFPMFPRPDGPTVAVGADVGDALKRVAQFGDHVGLVAHNGKLVVVGTDYSIMCVCQLNVAVAGELNVGIGCASVAGRALRSPAKLIVGQHWIWFDNEDVTVACTCKEFGKPVGDVQLHTKVVWNGADLKAGASGIDLNSEHVLITLTDDTCTFTESDGAYEFALPCKVEPVEMHVNLFDVDGVWVLPLVGDEPGIAIAPKYLAKAAKDGAHTFWLGQTDKFEIMLFGGSDVQR